MLRDKKGDLENANCKGGTYIGNSWQFFSQDLVKGAYPMALIKVGADLVTSITLISQHSL